MASVGSYSVRNVSINMEKTRPVPTAEEDPRNILRTTKVILRIHVYYSV